MRHTRTRLPVLTVGAALLATTGLALPVTHAVEPGPRDEVRGRAGHVIATAEERLADARSRPAPTATGASPTAPNRPRAQRAAGDPLICDSNALSAANLGDRMVVRAYHPGAASLRVERQRDYGAWRPVFTVAGEIEQRSDRDINIATVFTYRLTATSSTGAVLLACETYPLLAADNDGRIQPDFVVGTDNLLLREAFWSGFVPPDGVPGIHITPAFSADGRLIASTVVDPDTGLGRLVVRDAATEVVTFTVDLGAEVTPADAAFSPDGQTLAFTRYDNATGDSRGLAFVDVHGAHTVRNHGVTAAPLAEPTWRADSSGLVATDLRLGEGLVSTCATCTSATPIAATRDGYTPDVGVDGVLRFALTDETTSRIVRHTGTGVVTVATGEPEHVLSTPRTSPNGRVHYLVEDYGTASEWSVPARIMSLREDGGLEFWRNEIFNAYGFDIRQVASKDTSDVVGSAHHDIVARDSAGVLWAYAGEGSVGLGARVRLGGGWNAFTRILVAGDLTGDDRADLLATDSLGKLWLWKGTGRGAFSAKVQIGSGWSSGYTLVAPGDLTGDQRADLVARDASGVLWLYAGTGRGTVGSRTAIGSGWMNQNAILGSGDVDYDSRADLVSRDTRGRLWLWPGDGRGRLRAARLLGTGFGSYTALTVTGVTNQRALVWGRTTAGVLGAHDIYADGSFSPNGYYALGSGWNAMTLITS